MKKEIQDISSAAAEPASSGQPVQKKQHRLLWSIVFIIIAAASIWAVTAQNGNFSIAAFFAFVRKCNPIFLIAAILCMLIFILAEGGAILTMCRAFGYRRSLRDGFFYSASDIYFSAITPSATGGQPACAFFMMRDGIPGSTTTVILLLNIVMYSVSILIIGVLCFIFQPSIFLWFSIPARILILVGIVIQVLLCSFFILLLKKEKILHLLCGKILSFLSRIHLIRNLPRKQQKLEKIIADYRTCAQAISGQKQLLLRVFLLNLLQRAGQLSVTVCAFLATTGGTFTDALHILVLQSFVVIGSNCIPIPGAMGVVDYLLLDGFRNIMDSASAVNLELLSRSISFYFCTLLCGAAALIKYILQRTGRRKKQ